MLTFGCHKNFHRALCACALYVAASASSALAAGGTMRCGSALVSLGESAQVVRLKCGEPDTESSEGPALRNNGVPRRNAAKIMDWKYGPHHGMYQQLRFIDDKLVSIQSRRG